MFIERNEIVSFNNYLRADSFQYWRSDVLFKRLIKFKIILLLFVFSIEWINIRWIVVLHEPISRFSLVSDKLLYKKKTTTTTIELFVTNKKNETIYFTWIWIHCFESDFDRVDCNKIDIRRRRWCSNILQNKQANMLIKQEIKCRIENKYTFVNASKERFGREECALDVRAAKVERIWIRIPMSWQSAFSIVIIIIIIFHEERQNINK